jgi:oxygen-independent coproporphyrinogen-3 oxidase
MSGIYIHIPFCKQACHYCDFHFSTSLQNKEAFINALIKEIEIQKHFFKDSNNAISTIYFGGGTPSLLNQTELMRLFDALNKHFNINATAEITLEANPDDITKEKLDAFKHTPINRLSIGIQSFYDEDLKLMNRAHTSKEASYAVKATQDKGFENITIDLIYGIQTLSNEKWQNNLQQAFELQTKHISAYCLTVEEKTALAHFIKTGKLNDVDEEKNAAQFEIMLNAMEQNDFIQYEISNFCKENFYSKHNSNYWLKEKYLGLGPSAHSYNGTKRSWNIANNAQYIKSIEQNKLNYEEETLSNSQRYNEYVMTSLRTIWGTNLSLLKNNYGIEFKNYFTKEAEGYLQSNYLLLSNNIVTLSKQGKLIADKIASDLFWIGND